MRCCSDKMGATGLPRGVHNQTKVGVRWGERYWGLLKGDVLLIAKINRAMWAQLCECDLTYTAFNIYYQLCICMHIHNIYIYVGN